MAGRVTADSLHAKLMLWMEIVGVGTAADASAHYCCVEKARHHDAISGACLAVGQDERKRW